MSARQIPETDWRKWRALAKIALDRYCAHVLDDVAPLARQAGPAHQRYLDLWKLMKEADKAIALVFDNLKRSTAFVAIASALDRGMISWDELSDFTEETQSVIKMLME